MDADKLGIVLGLLLIGFALAAIVAVFTTEQWADAVALAQLRMDRL